MSENQERTHDQDQGNPQPCCDGGSCCPSGSTGIGQRGKIIAFVLVLLAAGAVLANSLIRKSRADADQPQQAFTGIQMNNTSEAAPLPNSEISETKLVQAFVTASRPSSGCGPAGCGPAGCN